MKLMNTELQSEPLHAKIQNVLCGKAASEVGPSIVDAGPVDLFQRVSCVKAAGGFQYRAQ